MNVKTQDDDTFGAHHSALTEYALLRTQNELFSERRTHRSVNAGSQTKPEKIKSLPPLRRHTSAGGILLLYSFPLLTLSSEQPRASCHCISSRRAPKETFKPSAYPYQRQLPTQPAYYCSNNPKVPQQRCFWLLSHHFHPVNS